MKPYTGKEGCLLQTQPDGERETCRRMATQAEDLDRKTMTQ
jgi:hypothetical protein